MLFRNILLPAVIVPTVGAMLVFALLSRGVREGSARRGRAATALAVAFLSAFVALTGWPRWPPIEATQRIFFLVALAALAAWFVQPERQPARVWAVRGSLTALLLVSVLQAPLENRWSAAQAVGWLGGLSLVGLGLHWAWARNLETEGGRGDHAAAIVRLALLGGTAASLGLSGSARLGLLAGALTCGVGGVEAGSRVLSRSPWHGGASLVLVTAVLGLVVAGHAYSDLQALPAALIVTAALMIGPATGRGHRLRWWALAPMALALGLLLETALSRPVDPYAGY